MDIAKAKPVFARRIFWDVNFDTPDYEAKASLIIERVFERGDVRDTRNCRRYYGDERISAALLNARFLSLPTTYLAAAVIGRPITDFKCYKPKHPNPEHWMY